jgi:hypothetical protein
MSAAFRGVTIRWGHDQLPLRVRSTREGEVFEAD